MERFPVNPFREPTTGVREYKPPRVDTQDREKEIYVTTDVSAYLEDTGRKELCENIFTCDKWKVEPVLLEELAHEQDDTKRNKLRGLIRAVSNFPPDRRPIEEQLKEVEMDTRLHDDDWEEIEEAVRGSEIGDAIEYAVSLIEPRYQRLIALWKSLDEGVAKDGIRKQIDELRPIRDNLYMRRVHPVWAKRVLLNERIEKPTKAA